MKTSTSLRAWGLFPQTTTPLTGQTQDSTNHHHHWLTSIKLQWMVKIYIWSMSMSNLTKGRLLSTSGLAILDLCVNHSHTKKKSTNKKKIHVQVSTR